jgi:hypothetical protein
VDRFIPQNGAAPAVEDLLSPQRSAMIALGYLAQAVMGTSAFVAGLGCTPAPGLAVNIGPGIISQYTVVDQSPYGTLPAVADPLLKLGVTTSTTLFDFAAPQTAGQSINYLIEAQFLETPDTPAVLQYYNAANPSQPFSGPGGGGAAFNTRVSQRVQLQVKSGVSANTGTQGTPGVDAGWVPLWIITVNYGASSVLAANIVQHPSAPFLPNTLPGLRKPVVGGTLNFYISNAGNDSNPGTNISFPLATINRALSLAATYYDLVGTTVRINLANGTYSGCLVNGSQVSCVVNLVGNVASPESVVISQPGGIAVESVYSAKLVVSGFTVQATGSTADYETSGVGLLAAGQGLIIVGPGMIFGECSLAHMEASQGDITVQSLAPGQGTPYTISGSALIHWYAGSAGYIAAADSTITIATPNLNFGDWFASASCGILEVWNCTFTGPGASSVTGTRYVASQGGVINTQGAGPNYLPGNTAGSNATGYYA